MKVKTLFGLAEKALLQAANREAIPLEQRAMAIRGEAEKAILSDRGLLQTQVSPVLDEQQNVIGVEYDEPETKTVDQTVAQPTALAGGTSLPGQPSADPAPVAKGEEPLPKS